MKLSKPWEGKMNCYRYDVWLRAVTAMALAVTLCLSLGAEPAWPIVPGGTPTFTDPLNMTNTYMPFQLNGVKVFQGSDHGAKTVVVDQYLAETRNFNWNGTTVECRVLREVAFEKGELVEISDNYFAQADDGTVYYFGEVVENYEDGVVTDNDGSWLVGGPTLPTDPADAGNDTDPTVFMPANPEVGDVFKPEDLPGVVDETAEVVDVDVRVKVPAGRYEDAIKVQETSALEPGTTFKWYAPGVGVVMEKAKRERLDLISSTLAVP
jgi:hypothetical protein